MPSDIPSKENVVKIDTNVKSVVPARSRDVKADKDSAAASPSGLAAAVSDEVRLTGTSAKLRHLEAELAGVDVADAGKVEAVRQALADGSFTVDEEVVADGLIQESIDNITQQARR
ncbi:MAG: negative regulator of flagellin synthesis FlgM [bacterium]|nr:MAG: negative regulator of flagellin synthesis FlgM [bacterium]KAF0147579.1 MAG: negative regulator of flagellin synthesis FlgM [bacterium]KAF0169390.1 MAG: negative regulator of flagellin synthesis FlgM [bacterium]TXT17972.1 MAG: negative regulator of flagellin synthesis FlgM [bacterium]